MLYRTAARLVVAIVLALALLPASAGAQAGALERTDWNAVLAADPNITISATCFAPALPGVGPCIEVSGPVVVGSGLNGEPSIAGYAVTGNVSYGLLGGTAAAVIPVASGGTAGDIGALVYVQSPAGPRLLAALTGYKMSARLQDDGVVLSEAYYVGYEGNCCPSATATTTYAIQDGRLMETGRSFEPFGQAREVAVYHYYDLLNLRDFASAYAMLGPAMQAANPFERWVAGFATTTQTTVEAAWVADTNQVQVQLRASDRTLAGGTVIRSFAGTWTVIWDAAGLRWLLTDASIAPA
jgi:hypothetical protein